MKKLVLSLSLLCAVGAQGGMVVDLATRGEALCGKVCALVMNNKKASLGGAAVAYACYASCPAVRGMVHSVVRMLRDAEKSVHNGVHSLVDNVAKTAYNVAPMRKKADRPE